MTIRYPLGLLCLLAIPALIIIYIIKSHYTEQTVSSVYLWKLSERFLKKQKRLSGISGIISLILQIIAVIAITFAVIQPTYVVPNSAGVYCFILDATGSMNTAVDGKSRFEKGQDEIEKIINSSAGGSEYTLIVIRQDTSVVFEGWRDKKLAVGKLREQTSSWSSTPCTKALELAEGYYERNDATNTYLVTDKAYDATNITLIDVSSHEKNYALVSYDASVSRSKLTVSGEVISYEGDARLTVELYVDDVKKDISSVLVRKLEPTPYSFEVSGVESFSSVRVNIADEDALMADNEGVIFSVAKGDDNTILLVSDAPAYLEYAIKSLGTSNINVVQPATYIRDKSKYEGYSLYIFDSFSSGSLDEIPSGAPVWILNPQGSVARAGFGFQGINEAEGSGYFEPTYTRSTSSLATSLLQGIAKQQLAVKKYVRCMLNRNFTTVLQNDDDSLIFVGTNENGMRQAVFTFDLHDSNIALKVDFLPLIRNLLKFTLPNIIENSVFSVGDSVDINMLAGATNVSLESPSGKTIYPPTGVAYTSVALDEAGVYNLRVAVNGVERNYKLFARVPAEESYNIVAGQISLSGDGNGKMSDGFYDGLIAYFVVLMLVFIADWGVYCYEQYQLR